VSSSAEGAAEEVEVRRPRGRPDEGARDKLVEAATALFIERDYDEVPTEAILEAAGVSRGAMYHHFSTKLALFEAVYEKGEAELLGTLAVRMAPTTSSYDALVDAASIYLQVCETDPYLRRIGLRQARSVLGWERWRDLAMKHGLGLVIAMVQGAIEAGELESRDPTLTGQLLLAALIEGALAIVTASDPAAVRAEVDALIVNLLDGLRRSSGPV
jgi:AcrR family transcriptional regulator